MRYIEKCLYRNRKPTETATDQAIPGFQNFNMLGMRLKTTSKAVAQRCPVKRVFLEISPNSQENIYVRVTFLIKLQD